MCIARESKLSYQGLLSAGQSITVSGVVTGDIRLTGQIIGIPGTVRRNAAIVSQTTTLTSEGSVKGEILFAGQTVALNGLVGKGISGVGQTITLNGRVNGDVWFAGQTLAVGDTAVIVGDLKYTSQKQTQIPKSASISGAVTFTQAEKENREKRQSIVSAANPGARVGRMLLGIGWNLFIVALLVFFLPKQVARIVALMKVKPVKIGAVGCLALLIVPIAGILLALTIIGIPFAIVVFMLYALAVGLSRSFAALITGAYAVERFFPKKKASRWLPVILGVPVLWLIFQVPFIGGIISFLAVCWGMGGMVKAFRSRGK
jgi:cytoskeletal protein CcmA (bactofilin family)